MGLVVPLGKVPAFGLGTNHPTLIMFMSSPDINLLVKRKPFLGTVQFKLRNNLLEILHLTDLPRIIEITYDNRNIQSEKISKEILEILGKTKD